MSIRFQEWNSAVSRPVERHGQFRRGTDPATRAGRWGATPALTRGATLRDRRTSLRWFPVGSSQLFRRIQVNVSRHSARWLLAIVAFAPSINAQQRAVNLTGRPVATLDEGITSITGLQEVAPGKVVISDIQEQRLLFADLGTNSLRDIASKGGGPGEWQIAMSVSPGPGGTAYVADPSLRKLHVIDATGKIVRTVPFPGADANSSPGTFAIVLPRGTDNQGRVFLSGRPFTPGSQEQPDSIPIMRWDPQTNRTDTLAMVKNETQVTQSGGSGNTRVMARVGNGPFSPSTIWTPLRDGRVALVHPNPYRVDIIEARGRVRTGTAVPYTPIRIGKAERDQFRANQASQPRTTIRMGGGGGMNMTSGGGGPPPPAIPDSDFPATMPPFTGGGLGGGVVVSPNGEIWVLRTRAASDKTPTYDIWSSMGLLVGKATLKPNSTVVGFGQGAVYVARQDPEDDLRYLEKYAI